MSRRFKPVERHYCTPSVIIRLWSHTEKNFDRNYIFECSLVVEVSVAGWRLTAVGFVERTNCYKCLMSLLELSFHSLRLRCHRCSQLWFLRSSGSCLPLLSTYSTSMNSSLPRKCGWHRSQTNVTNSSFSYWISYCDLGLPVTEV